MAGRKGPKSRRILTLADAVDDFLESQKSNNCSRTTIEAQRIVLQQLVVFAQENDWPTVDEINQRHLRKYLNYLKDRPRWSGERRGNSATSATISVAYYDTIYRRFRRFFNFLKAEGDIDDNPMSHIEQPKLTEKIIPIVEDDDKEKLLRVTNPRRARTKREVFQMTRDSAVLWFFYDTSARRAGISTCQISDPDLEEGSIIVVEKGCKERYLSLTGPH